MFRVRWYTGTESHLQANSCDCYTHCQERRPEHSVQKQGLVRQGPDASRQSLVRPGDEARGPPNQFRHQHMSLWLPRPFHASGKNRNHVSLLARTIDSLLRHPRAPMQSADTTIESTPSEDLAVNIPYDEPVNQAHIYVRSYALSVVPQTSAYSGFWFPRLALPIQCCMSASHVTNDCLHRHWSASAYRCSCTTSLA